MTPDELVATIADIIDTLSSGVTVGEGRAIRDGGTFHHESVGQAFRWFHGAAFSQRAGASGSSQLCDKCQGYGWVTREVPNPMGDGPRWFSSERCESCTPRTVHDPTGDAVIAQRELRGKVTEVGNAIEAARREVHRAVAALRACETIVDEGVSRELPHERTMPRTVDKGELGRAKDAQQRRIERGEGVA